jgi:TfoX/Sxy family transcriptional regulator of competence genes
MASDKAFLEYILGQLNDLDDISWRGMMGEFILSYRDRVFGGLYDNRFLVKPVKAAVEMMPEADRDIPYEGAKEMLVVENIENREFLRDLVEAMYPQLPAPKKRK